MKPARIVSAFMLVAYSLTARGQDCVDIEGEWELTEQVTVRCCAGGRCDTTSDEKTGFVFFEQDGCEVSYTVPGTDLVRAGEIVGDMIHLRGRLADPPPGATITENTLDIRGTVSPTTMQLTGSGRLRGSIEGQSFECTATSNASGQRDAPVPTNTAAPATATPTATASSTRTPTRTPTCGAPFGLESPVDPPNIVDGHLCGRTAERDEVGFKNQWQDLDDKAFDLSCEADLRFHLTFTSGGGPDLLVGLCAWDEGLNFATVLAGNNRRGGDRYDCFQRTFWFSREPGLEQGTPNTVDWIEYRYDVRTGRRISEHWISGDGEGARCPDCKVCAAEDIDPLDFPPVADCVTPLPPGGPPAFCFRSACDPGSAAAAAPGGIDTTPSGFMTALDVHDRCDVDFNGACDADDFALVRGSIGQCEGDPTFLHTADADFDDCITDTDVVLFFPRACFGDCDGGGSVTINELIQAVNVALGLIPASMCASVDVDSNGQVAVAELIRAVGASLNGCDF